MAYRMIFAFSCGIFFFIYFLGWYGLFDKYIDGVNTKVGSYGISAYVIGLFYTKVLSQNARWVLLKKSD